jgi:hypothetical protein
MRTQNLDRVIFKVFLNQSSPLDRKNLIRVVGSKIILKFNFLAIFKNGFMKIIFS